MNNRDPYSPYCGEPEHPLGGVSIEDKRMLVEFTRAALQGLLSNRGVGGSSHVALDAVRIAEQAVKEVKERTR